MGGPYQDQLSLPRLTRYLVPLTESAPASNKRAIVGPLQLWHAQYNGVFLLCKYSRWSYHQLVSKIIILIPLQWPAHFHLTAWVRCTDKTINPQPWNIHSNLTTVNWKLQPVFLSNIYMLKLQQDVHNLRLNTHSSRHWSTSDWYLNSRNKFQRNLHLISQREEHYFWKTRKSN